MDAELEGGLALKLHGARRLTIAAWPALKEAKGSVVLISGNSAVFPKAPSDVGNKVRLIAFRNTDFPEDVVGTLREEWLDADLFYGVLSRWSELFAAEWARKIEQGSAASASRHR